MDRKELYRVTKGKLTRSDLEIPLDFGIIYENDGIIYADLYVNESYNLNRFPDITNNEAIILWTAFCQTDDKNSIEIRGLDYREISPTKGLVEMICYDSLIFTQNKTYLKSDPPNENPSLHYLILEGLEMYFCSRPDPNSFDDSNIGRHAEALLDKWNHTGTGLSHNMCLYNMDYHKDYNSGNIIVSFRSESNSILSYKVFQEFKRDYVSMLSFLNGAPVRVRKECFGEYHTIGRPEAENDVTYSFRKIINERFNQYIPLNNVLNRSTNILNKFSVQNFDIFCEWNKKIDLNSIIHYLNGAVQTRSLEEHFFILIIAFERLTTLYAEQKGPKEVFHPTKENYTPIKDKLFSILEEHKSEFGEYFSNAKSTIGGLNQMKRLSTKDKMHGIINDTGLMTDEIMALIDEVRHEAVHKGNIGEGREGYKNVFLLNELIHEIILRLIKFQGPRKSMVLFGRTMVSGDTYVSPLMIYEVGQDITTNPK
jgi:hypothetical protein